jgi:hypothetical protein
MERNGSGTGRLAHTSFSPNHDQTFWFFIKAI